MSEAAPKVVVVVTEPQSVNPFTVVQNANQKKEKCFELYTKWRL
jgi:hypothetical protein